MRRQRQKGHALIELALLLPVLATLLLGIIEVGNAINAYLTITEASRDGARLVVREGPSANVYGLVQSLTDRLPNSTLAAFSSYGYDSKGNQTVTVEVRYDYRFIIGSVPLVASFLPNPFTLRANTTMPIP